MVEAGLWGAFHCCLSRRDLVKTEQIWIWRIKGLNVDPQPSSMSSTSSSSLLPLLQSTAWAQHYRKRMQRSKWEAPDRFNHAARISDLCKELLIYDTSCQSGRFWNNKCFRRRRASTYLDLFFLEFNFLFVCIAARSPWIPQRSHLTKHMAAFLKTQWAYFKHPSGDGRQQKIQYKVFSACLGGEQPISFLSALMRAGCDKVLLRRKCNGYISNCVVVLF